MATKAKKTKTTTKPGTDASVSKRIDAHLADLGDWRGETLGKMRGLILEADPQIIEEWKWGIPVWSQNGIICTGETYKKAVKLTFAKGAALPDPKGLFNSSLEGNTRRAIDLPEGGKVDARAFKALVKAAVAHNAESGSKKTKTKAASKPKAKAGEVKLLSGGNPQIPKGDGDAPVQAYIAAMPEWKQAVGKKLDALIVRAVPKVKKAVRWNSPMYAVEGGGFFVSFHVFARYVKVTFFQGASLKPLPPGPSKDKNTRYLDVYEDGFDEAQFTKWVKQAAALPGWTP